MKFNELPSGSRGAAITALGEALATSNISHPEKAKQIAESIAQAFISLEQYDSAPDQSTDKIKIGDGTI